MQNKLFKLLVISTSFHAFGSDAEMRIKYTGSVKPATSVVLPRDPSEGTRDAAGIVSSFAGSFGEADGYLDSEPSSGAVGSKRRYPDGESRASRDAGVARTGEISKSKRGRRLEGLPFGSEVPDESDTTSVIYVRYKMAEYFKTDPTPKTYKEWVEIIWPEGVERPVSFPSSVIYCAFNATREYKHLKETYVKDKEHIEFGSVVPDEGDTTSLTYVRFKMAEYFKTDPTPKTYKEWMEIIWPEGVERPMPIPSSVIYCAFNGTREYKDLKETYILPSRGSALRAKPAGLPPVYGGAGVAGHDDDSIAVADAGVAAVDDGVVHDDAGNLVYNGDPFGIWS